MMFEQEREALMRLTMCAREECAMCKYEETCNFDFQYELATKSMNILADALRTASLSEKLTSSEIPNNCDTCRNWDIVNDHCYFIQECRYEPKDDSIPHDDYIESENDHLEAKCLNCANGGTYKCSKCDGEMYFKIEPHHSGEATEMVEPQTAECPFDDAIPCEWVNCPNSPNCPYKPKTEPQTEGASK